MTLIVRINRGLPLGSEGELLQRLEVEGRRATRPAGLIGGSIGPDWAKPAPILGFDIEMSDRSIEHLESVVADVDELFGR